MRRADVLLTATQVTEAMRTLPGWAIVDSAIVRQFEFNDFRSAWQFMSGVALLAERFDHHPDWSNSYATVTINLSTHSAGRITVRDIELASAITGLLGSM